MKLKGDNSSFAGKTRSEFDAGQPSPRSARTSRSTDSLDKRLSLYALAATAAGVSVLALASPAEGRIVFTPAHARITPGHKFFLDLNHDGIKDFELTDTAAGSSYFLDMNPLQTGNGLVEAHTDCNPLPGAAAIKAGVVIGKGEVFGNYYCMAQVVGADGSFSLGSWGGGVKNRFLGLQFMINGQKHFGWARFSVSKKPFIASLNGYAYETTANKPIIAGKTRSAETETTSARISSRPAAGLGTLAMGADGLLPSDLKRVGDAKGF